MPLEVLVVMVVVGIAIVIAAVAFSGLSRGARIDSEGQIRRRLSDDFPEVVLRDGLITSDRRTAFFRCGDGRVAIATALGSRFVTRLIDARQVRRLELGEAGEATLELRDFTLARMRLGFDEAAEARRLSQWLEASDHA
ncbi:MAG: hypothetical protein BroJett030_06170 [Alphaproteobacteria bacterium]|nr:MAG: hypothetical protein BroJett030_06170 [Alphaproteobacteria bacterium]